MKVKDNSTNQLPVVMQTCDVPVGTTFRGTIVSTITGTKETGIFYKAHGKFNFNRTIPTDNVIVCLDVHENLWTSNSPILNYEPLDVTLVINGPARA